MVTAYLVQGKGGKASFHLCNSQGNEDATNTGGAELSLPTG